MDSFENKIAVVTGGGAGMGRELVRQLAKEGCNIAMCDVMEENMQETVDIVSSESPEVKITSFKCDVSLEGDVFSFKDKVIEEHKTDHINLLFNNAGIGGGGSFLARRSRRMGKNFCHMLAWGLLLLKGFHALFSSKHRRTYHQYQ